MNPNPIGMASKPGAAAVMVTSNSVTSKPGPVDDLSPLSLTCCSEAKTLTARHVVPTGPLAGQLVKTAEPARPLKWNTFVEPGAAPATLGINPSAANAAKTRMLRRIMAPPSRWAKTLPTRLGEHRTLLVSIRKEASRNVHRVVRAAWTSRWVDVPAWPPR